MGKRKTTTPEHIHAKSRPLLDLINLCNVVSFYREELGQILEGNYTKDLLSSYDEARLFRLGLIERHKRVYMVPWEVEKLMDRLKN